MDKIAVILAGGTGGRLWPESTEINPKQFRSFVSDVPMVLDTYNLLKKNYEVEQIYVLTFNRYKELLQSVIQEIPEENILLEPFGRNTAPAIALAAMLLKHKHDENCVVTYFPSDHIIDEAEEFLSAVNTSIEVAKKMNNIVSVGVVPLSPNNQLGYIQYSENGISETEYYDLGLRKSKVFAEKPDTDTAQRFIDSGDFVWNTGVFSAKINTLNAEIKNHLPLLSNLIGKIESKLGDEKYSDNLEFTYKQINSISIDNGLLEKTDNLYVIKSKFGWSDLGTWDEYFQQREKDKHNNVLQGNVIALKTSNSLIKSKDKLIAVTDVDDLIVIESDNSIFICKRGSSEKVKDLIHHIRAKELKKLL